MRKPKESWIQKDSIPEKRIDQINQRKEQIYGRKTKAGKSVTGFEANYKPCENYVTIPLLDILTFNLDTIWHFHIWGIRHYYSETIRENTLNLFCLENRIKKISSKEYMYTALQGGKGRRRKKKQTQNTTKPQKTNHSVVRLPPTTPRSAKLRNILHRCC